ncbi:MAG TPA: hypothetical protein DDX71_02210 [Ruminococcus sp.]|nr:hypothetical protein [Ruminococcus sp.]
MKLPLHIGVIAGTLGLLLGVPCLTSDAIRAKLSGTDAVSSASVIVEQPSGDYLVLINLDRHTDSENLALWHDFFTGADAPVIFEDISCGTALSDAGGRTMADSFRSRLPENQMTVRAEDGTLLLSKAETGRFDIIILSQEIADALHAETVTELPNVETLHVKGASG